MIDPPVPYKPGTEAAQWPVKARAKSVQWGTVLLVAIPLLILVVGAVVSVATHN